MTPTHANKKGRRYRYYVTNSLIKRGRPKASDAARRVPAGELERLVEERIISFLKDEGELHGVIAQQITDAHELETLIAEASRLAVRWTNMPSVEKRQRLQCLVARIILKPDALEISIRSSLLAEFLRSSDNVTARKSTKLPDEPVLVLTINVRLKRTGIEKKLLIRGADKRPATTADTSLLKLIARAQVLQEIFTRGGQPISEMAKAAGVSTSYFTRVLRLSFLAPDITKAILGGDLPADLTARNLMTDTRVPFAWDEQHARFDAA